MTEGSMALVTITPFDHFASTTKIQSCQVCEINLRLKGQSKTDNPEKLAT